MTGALVVGPAILERQNDARGRIGLNRGDTMIEELKFVMSEIKSMVIISVILDHLLLPMIILVLIAVHKFNHKLWELLFPSANSPQATKDVSFKLSILSVECHYHEEGMSLGSKDKNRERLSLLGAQGQDRLPTTRIPAKN
jgi:hypothetical protein